jgi:hypothetical protein
MMTSTGRTENDTGGSPSGDISSPGHDNAKKNDDHGARRRSRGRARAMAATDGRYYYAEDVDRNQSEIEMWWKVVTILMGLVLVLLTGTFMYQLYELWELSEISNEMEADKSSLKSGRNNNIMPLSKDREVGDIGAKPFEVVLPQECIAMTSALPEGNEACRKALARTITPAMRSAYNHEGVVAIRGLLTTSQIESLDKSAEELLHQETERKGGPTKARSRKGNQFYTDKSGALFLDLDRGDGNVFLPEQQACGVDEGQGQCLASSAKENVNGDDDDDGDNDTTGVPSKPASMAAFRHVALMSAVPLVAADLMGMGQGKAGDETLRVIRDIFLAKDEGEYVCGWHVDDHGFWPAQASSPGINAWISVDDVPPGPGGTFALAVGSHAANWKDDAHEAIGSVMTYPENGFKDAQDMVKNRPGAGTCNLESAAPETYEKMENSKRIYDLRKGDVIFHERWLFHRTVPFDREIVHNHKLRYWGFKGGYEKEPPPPLMKRRYSVRYGPGSSLVIKGWGTEPSVLWKEDNAGKTADEVSQVDGPWYPRCWPGIDPKEIESMKELVETRFPVTKERKKERMDEMKSFLREQKEAERIQRTAAAAARSTGTNRRTN